MSGIFKSVKKVLKKVGKIVKKIAPYLILAAGVYFGGSYLMSVAGGATAGAAGSAAQSFTKSAGVWKSFMGGLANGNAASSAATYAEASYGVMKAGGSLAQQTAAATKAVNLYPTLGVNGAVKSVTTNDAWKAFVPNQGDPNVFQTYMNADSAMPVTDNMSSNVVGSDVRLAQVSAGPGGGMIETTPSFQQQHANEFDIGGMITQKPPAPTVHEQAPRVVAGAGSVGGVTPKAATPTAPGSSTDVVAGAGSKSGMTTMERLIDQQTKQAASAQMQSQHNFELQMAATQNAHTQGMYGLLLQGGGALLQAWGAHQTAQDEKEWREKGLKWKAPKDPIDVVNPNLRIDKTEVA